MANSFDFGQSIRFHFKDLITEFNLRFDKPYADGDAFLLEGEKCDLRFTYDRGETGCAFKQKNQRFNPGYQVDFVCQFLHPFDRISDERTTDYYNPDLVLAWYASIIQNDLKNVLQGDFSWLNDYILKKDMHRYLGFLALSLEYDHPIHRKFIKGDATWYADAENYAFDNNLLHR